MTSTRLYLRNWWPVALWVGVIFAESTSYGSATNTYSWMLRVLMFLHIRIDWQLLFELNHLLRKCGHFLGYAILSVLTFYALRNTYRDRVRLLAERSWGSMFADFWHPAWAFYAVLLTIAMASYDEIHQTFLPSRTGRWQDVVIDTSGAIVAQFVIYLLALWSAQRQQPAVTELSLHR